MSKVVTGVTIQTFPRAVREAGLKPGQRFTVVVEDEDRETLIQKMNQIAEAVGKRVTDDGLTEEDVLDHIDNELIASQGTGEAL